MRVYGIVLLHGALVRSLEEERLQARVLLSVLHACDNSTDVVFKCPWLPMAAFDQWVRLRRALLIDIGVQSLYLIIPTPWWNCVTAASLMASALLLSTIRWIDCHQILSLALRTKGWSSHRETILNVEVHAPSIFCLFATVHANVVILRIP